MRLVIVTGMSGAGRTTALKVLEDAVIFVWIICRFLLSINLQS